MSVVLKQTKKKHNNNLKVLFSFIIVAIILIFSTISIKNFIITKKCKDSLYAIDYYLTHYNDKNLRLIKVEAISVVNQEKNKFTIKASGMQSVEPYTKITIISTFTKDKNGVWQLTDVKDATINENKNTNEGKDTDD